MNVFLKIRLVLVGFLAAYLGACAGCVSKSKAEAQARAAYLAGQQDAAARLQRNQLQGAIVTINGLVRQSVLPWTQQMTVGTALIAADYYGPDPTQIVIMRGGRALTVEAADLLAGRDVQLLAGDVVQIQTGTVVSPGNPVVPTR